MGIEFLKLLGYLAAFLVVLIAARWVALWYAKQYGSVPGAKSSLQVKDKRLLGKDQALYVVTYEDCQLLLGVCPGSMTVLEKRPVKDVRTDEE